MDERCAKVTRQTDNPYLNLYHINAKTKSGKDFDYYFASRNSEEQLKVKTHSQRAEGMAIYAISKEEPGKLVLIRQFRYPLNDYIYELPAGLIESDESAEEAAVREMKEETGLELLVYEGGADYLKRPLYLAQGMTDESGKMVFGYVKGTVSDKAQEDSEDIQVLFVDKKEARRILAEERVSMRAGLMLLHFLRTAKEEPFSFLDEIAQD